ncbi:MAG: hypothetical protein KAJ03_03440 [Gammaproteobacteria bacterium]|nr:hypothetical protein [Gammaproteobacteria bacterium]
MAKSIGPTGSVKKNFYMPKDYDVLLQHMGEEHGTPQSTIMRNALIQYFWQRYGINLTPSGLRKVSIEKQIKECIPAHLEDMMNPRGMTKRDINVLDPDKEETVKEDVSAEDILEDDDAITDEDFEESMRLAD